VVGIEKFMRKWNLRKLLPTDQQRFREFYHNSDKLVESHFNAVLHGEFVLAFQEISFSQDEWRW